MPYVLELEEKKITISEHSTMNDHITFEMAPEMTLKIETSPGGDEIANVTVPVGKKWMVVMHVNIIEEDV